MRVVSHCLCCRRKAGSAAARGAFCGEAAPGLRISGVCTSSAAALCQGDMGAASSHPTGIERDVLGGAEQKTLTSRVQMMGSLHHTL